LRSLLLWCLWNSWPCLTLARNANHQKLPPFNEFVRIDKAVRMGSVNRIMRLDVEEIPSGAENLRDVDDARAFLVNRERSGRCQIHAAEPAWVVLGDLHELVADVIEPDLRIVRRVAGVFLNHDSSGAVDRDVVEHIAAFGPVEQHLNGPADSRIC